MKLESCINTSSKPQQRQRLEKQRMTTKYIIEAEGKTANDKKKIKKSKNHGCVKTTNTEHHTQGENFVFTPLHP